MRRKHSYRHSLFSLLVGILLVCLIINRVSFICDASRNSAFFILPLILLLMGLSSICLHHKWKIGLNWIDIFVTLALSVYLCVYFSSLNLPTMGGFSLLLLYWMIRFSPKVRYDILYYSILLSTFLLSLIGYLQFTKIIPGNHSGFGIIGFYSSPAIYAGVLCLLLSILLTCCIHPGYRYRYRVSYYLTIAVCVVSLPIFLIADSRASWIALLVAVSRSIYVYYLQSKNRFSLLFSRFKSVAFLLVVISVYALYQLKPESAQGRLLIWKVTLRMINEKPLTGFGPEGFATYYMHYQADYLKTSATLRESYLADSNHIVYNEPLRLMVEYGVVGLLAYICLLCIVLVVPYRKDLFVVSIQSLLAAYLVWGLFAYPDQVFCIQTLAVLALAYLSCYCPKPFILFYFNVFIRRIWYIVVFVAVVTLILLLSRYYQHHRAFYEIIEKTAYDQPSESIKQLAPLEVGMQDEPLFWMYYCTLLNRINADSLLPQKIDNWERLYPTPDTYIMKGDLLQRFSRYREAESSFLLAANMVPTRQRARARLALLYKLCGRDEEAVHLVRNILTEKVKTYGFETYELHKELQRIFEDQLK